MNAMTQPEGIVAEKNEDTGGGSYRATASEIRQFIERIERLNAEKQDIADQIKEVFSEAKSRGYMVMALRKLIAERKKDPDQLSELEAVTEMYREAMGVA